MNILNTFKIGDVIALVFGAVGMIAAATVFVTATKVNSAELVRVNEKVDAVESRTNDRMADLRLTLRRMEDKLDRILTQR
jgi:hypothetical protein